MREPRGKAPMITICENYAARPGALGLEVLRNTDTTDPGGNPIYKRISWQPSLAAALMAVKKDRELQTLSDDITLDEAIKRLLRIETDMLTAIQTLNRGPAAAIAREAAFGKEMRNRMRENLREARRKAGMTQQTMADLLKLNLRHYQKIEYGEIGGSFEIWDALEDMLGIHQRILRENSGSCPSPKENP